MKTPNSVTNLGRKASLTILALFLLSNLSVGEQIPSSQNPLKRVALYNVVWESPSKDYTGSMPIGNGDIGLNAWVEESGDLLFYIGKTDSWDDNGRLVKIGRVRITIDPRPNTPLTEFHQALSLPTGTVKVHYGKGIGAVDMQIWVDALHPVVHVEVTSQRATKAVASIELWRTAPTVLPSVEVSDIMTDRKKKNGQHEPTIVEADSVLKRQRDRIGWFHHNAKSVGPALCARIQGLQGFQREDPLLHRTFGAVITTTDPNRIDDLHLQSSSAQHHIFDICVLTRHPATPQSWLKAVDDVKSKIERTPYDKQRKAHERWWREFWTRSWISVTAGAGDDSLARETYSVSQAYALQRFVNACAGRGQFPIKFNGSIFTVPFPTGPGDADYRRWGPGYWWQNTRLPYISMCASGDFDLMEPLFRMYGKDLMPLFKYRTRHYLGHDGIYVPECIYFWGDVFTESYGWTPFEERSDKLQESGWHKWEWVSGLELVHLMLEYYDYTLDERFLRAMVLPSAHEVLTFFDQHYKTDEQGKLLMRPSQAAETWWECTNPMPEVAGLHSITERLLALPESKTAKDERAFWAALNRKLPDLPIREVNSTKMLAPASKFANKMNIENPELYAVFPFRLVSLEKPDVALAIEALKHRWDKGNFGWRQDDIFMAYLGLADSARTYLVGRSNNHHLGSRFPAFWGPNYDWVPDQDHGGILLKALQSMILQTDGKKIFLLPAWPRDWNAEFKLHAPHNTVVKGTISNGKLVQLDVSPKVRRNDLVVMQSQ